MKKNWKHKFNSKSPLKQSSKEEFVRNIRFKPENSEELREKLEDDYTLPLKPGDERPTLHHDWKPSTVLDTDAKLDVANWLMERKNTGRYDEQLGYGHLGNQILNIGALKNFENKTDFATAMYNKIQQAEIPEDLEGIIKNPSYFKEAKEIKSEQELERLLTEDMGDNVQGVYMKGLHGKFQGKSGWLDDSAISIDRHETTHGLNALPQENKIAEIMNFDPLNSELDRKSYMRKPTEMYSRLMQLRLNNNLDPNKLWTQEDLPYLKNLIDDQQLHLNPKDLGKDPKTGKFRMTDEILLKLMNEVADTDNPSDRDLLERMKIQSRA